jgi:hypothetical protein
MSAPLRIQQKPTVMALGAEAVGAGPVVLAGGNGDFKGYLDRLMKMIPGEAIGLYLVGSGFIPKDQAVVLAVWTIVCLLGVIAIKAYGTSDPAAQLRADWGHVAISAVAFLIWVYSIGGPFTAYNVAVPYIGSLLVLAWTFFVPLLYRGSAP